MARRSTIAAVAAAVWRRGRRAPSPSPRPARLRCRHAVRVSRLLALDPPPDVLNVSQTVLHAPGACTAPTSGAVPIAFSNSAGTSRGRLSDGAYCFTIRATDLAGSSADSAGATAVVDTASPSAGLLVAGQAGGAVSGVVSLSATSADALSGVASSVVHVGSVGACSAGPVLGAVWDTTAYGNGAYDVCNVVSDNAGHNAIATVTVTVANAARAPAALVPGPGPKRKLDKVPPRPPTRIVVVAPRAKRGTRIVPLKLHWKKPKARDLDRVVIVLNLKHAPRGPADGRVINRGLRTTATFKFGSHANAHIALYAYDHSGNVSRASRQIVVAALADSPTAPRRERRAQGAAAAVEGAHAHRLLQPPALPQRASHARALALASVLPPAGGQAAAGHLRVVGVARHAAQGCRADVREADRALHVRGQGQAGRQGAVTAHSPKEFAGPAPGAVK